MSEKPPFKLIELECGVAFEVRQCGDVLCKSISGDAVAMSPDDLFALARSCSSSNDYPEWDLTNGVSYQAIDSSLVICDEEEMAEYIASNHEKQMIFEMARGQL